MDRLLQDARYAARRLRRSPGFTVAALLTLALGIGANALIFSVVNAVFLVPLPYRDADRLVWATEFFPKFNRSMVPSPEFAAWKQQSTLFEHMEAFGNTFGANVTSAQYPAERVQVAHVTPGFFDMVGVVPRLGAGFESGPETSSRPVAMISDALWRGFLHADSAIVGKTIDINAKPYTVVGVMPAGLLYPDGADAGVWLPDAVPPAAVVPSRSPQSTRLIGKLKPGVTVEQARLELQRIARSMDSQYPAPFGTYHAASSVRVASLQKQLTTNSELVTAVLMGAVGFLLLIACANVANLFLARAVARRKEIAMRTAIGARARDIVRMLLAESLLLSAFGGLLGIALLYWGRNGVMFLVPKAMAQGIPIDWRVLAFTAICSIAAGVLFGLIPAVAAARADVEAGLRQSTVQPKSRLPVFLAASQIALSMMLLAGAGLMIRSFYILATTNPGFDAHDVLTATAMLRPGDIYTPEKQVEFLDRMLAGVGKLPGVRYAAVTSSPPMAQFSAIETGLSGDNGPKLEDAVSLASVSAQYFQVLGIKLVSGRFFDERDVRGGSPVAIVNQDLARRLFRGRDPLGRRINGSVVVVGVVADVRHRALDDKVWPELFFPYAQSPSPWVTAVIRGAGDPSALAGPVRQVARAIDAGQPLFDVELLDEKVSASLAERRERSVILGAFAAFALLIAVVGIYGVVSYSVARQTQEIGLRLALGAGRGDVLGMVVNRGLRIAAYGIVTGLAGTLLVTRALKSFLYGIEPNDTLTICVVCAILVFAAFCASYLPARRAAGVDPMVALRQE